VSATGCLVAVDDFSQRHDYSQPPHNTPETPRRATDKEPCQSMSSDGKLGWCEHVAAYEVVVYQIGTHDWVVLDACFPCADSIKRRHAKLGPRGTAAVHSIRSVRRAA